MGALQRETVTDNHTQMQGVWFRQGEIFELKEYFWGHVDFLDWRNPVLQEKRHHKVLLP